ncbi:MAG: SDR family NAD(P)-dependent oxidoreductase [Pseudomonadota bacterium]
MELSGKTYWLVGASEGLGRALAKKLDALGVAVVVSARNKARLTELASEMSDRTVVLPVDVSDISKVKDAASKLPEVDGFIYAAGTYTPFSAQDYDAEAAEMMFEVNLQGASRVAATQIPVFAKRNKGHVVFIGSLSSYGGLRGSIGYSASKAGMKSLAESIQCDLFHTDVKVSLIHPGFIRTRLTDKNDFDMPQIMDPEEAADLVIKGMQKRQFEYSFPKPFALLFRASRLFPEWLYFRIFGLTQTSQDAADRPDPNGELSSTS